METSVDEGCLYFLILRNQKYNCVLNVTFFSHFLVSLHDVPHPKPRRSFSIFSVIGLILLLTPPPRTSYQCVNLFVLLFEAVALPYYTHTHRHFLQRLVLVLSLTTSTAAIDLSRRYMWDIFTHAVNTTPLSYLAGNVKPECCTCSPGQVL